MPQGSVANFHVLTHGDKRAGARHGPCASRVPSARRRSCAWACAGRWRLPCATGMGKHGWRSAGARRPRTIQCWVVTYRPPVGGGSPPPASGRAPLADGRHPSPGERRGGLLSGAGTRPVRRGPRRTAPRAPEAARRFVTPALRRPGSPRGAPALAARPMTRPSHTTMRPRTPTSSSGRGSLCSRAGTDPRAVQRVTRPLLGCPSGAAAQGTRRHRADAQAHDTAEERWGRRRTPHRSPTMLRLGRLISSRRGQLSSPGLHTTLCDRAAMAPARRPVKRAKAHMARVICRDQPVHLRPHRDPSPLRLWPLRSRAQSSIESRPRTTSSRYVRGRLGGMAIWRLQGPRCRAGLTVLPHVVLRDRQRPPAVAREAWLAHGAARWARGGLRCQVSPMALERLSWALGHPRLVAVLTRGERPRPADVLADEQPRHGLTRDSQRRGGHRERGRRWCQDQQAGWSRVRDDPQMPVRSTRRDQPITPSSGYASRCKAFTIQLATKRRVFEGSPIWTIGGPTSVAPGMPALVDRSRRRHSPATTGGSISNSHVWRLSMSGAILHHSMPWNVENNPMSEPLPIAKWLLCSTALNLVLGCAWGIQRQQIWQLRHLNHAYAHRTSARPRPGPSALMEKQDQPRRE